MIISRSVKGYYCRQMGRKMKALMTMLISYRRKYVASWFAEVLERFKDCSKMSPDYGKSIEWPKPPPAMTVSSIVLIAFHMYSYTCFVH